MSLPAYLPEDLLPLRPKLLLPLFPQTLLQPFLLPSLQLFKRQPQSASLSRRRLSR